MSSVWDKPERVTQLIRDLDAWVLAIDVGVAELPTGDELVCLVQVASRLAAIAAADLPDVGVRQ